LTEYQQLTGSYLDPRLFSYVLGTDLSTTDLHGLDTATFIIGDGAVDHLVGGAAGDVLDGRNGNDVLFGGGGDDTIVGGDGDDTAVFQLSSTHYDIERHGSEITVAGIGDIDIGFDGIDTLYDVEHLQFTDRTVNANELIDLSAGTQNGGNQSDGGIIT